MERITKYYQTFTKDNILIKSLEFSIDESLEIDTAKILIREDGKCIDISDLIHKHFSGELDDFVDKLVIY